MTPPAQSRRTRHAARRGGIYPLVLIVSATASAAVLTGLAIRQQTDARRADTADLADARLLARAGVESAMQVIDETSGWRDSTEINEGWSVDTDNGQLRVAVTDPTDGDLTDDDTDPYRITGTGAKGDAEASISIDFVYTTTGTYEERLWAAGPIAWWALDEEQGGSVFAEPTVGPQTGQYSSNMVPGSHTGPDGDPAPMFTNTSTTAFVPHYDDLLLDEGTVMFHVYCDRNISGDQTILAKDIDGNNGPGSIRVYLWRDDLRLVVRMENNSRTHELIPDRLATDTWTHIAITFGSNGLYCYIDGVERDKREDFTTGLGPAAGSSGNTHTLTLGLWYNGSSFQDPLNGSVRDLAFFDHQLSEAEIDALISDDTPMPELDPASWAWVTD